MRLNFFQVIPFVMQVLSILASVDANNDGIKSGPEKMQAAKKILVVAMQSFPEVSAKLKLDPEKTERFIGALVEALNIITT